MIWIKTLVPAVFLFATLTQPAKGADLVKLNRIYANLATERPVAVAIPPDGTGRMFLALQRGKILILPQDENASEAAVFLDLSGRALEAPDGQFEEGLNGLAFHPKFAENRQFYLAYTQQKPKRLVFSEMKAAADGAVADPASERVLLEVPLVNWNHHGGNILFGPDGFLYAGIGDTSKRDDQLRLAQNKVVLNGKVIRIDVNRRDWHGRYGIPGDNPFADGLNARSEIWAYGLRNPWGLHFDEQGRLWCADVGQDLWEEVNWITRGGNYGWSFREGARPFVVRTDPAPETEKLIDPVIEYNHGEGLSVTGGLVYRGDAMPDRKGDYIYGDFVIGKIWAARVSTDGKMEGNDLLYTSPQELADNPKKKPAVLVKPTAFGEDNRKEVLVLDWNGAIYRMAK